MGSLLSIGAVPVLQEQRYADQLCIKTQNRFNRAVEIAAWLPGWAKTQDRDLGELLKEADAADWRMFAAQAAHAAGNPIADSSKPYYPKVETRTLVRCILRFTGKVA